MVSGKKSAINLIGDPLYMTSYFSLAAFKISLSFTFISLTIMCLRVDCSGFILFKYHEFL